MPDSPNRATSFPLLSLPALLALAFVAGRFATHKLALETARPQAEPSFMESQCGEVQARLWQDPLRTAQDDAYDPKRHARLKRLAQRLAQVPRRLWAEGSAEVQTLLQNPQKRIRNRHEKGREVLVLPVLISGKPYPRDVESRLRTRYAVLAGLNVAGYEPDDADYIHYFIMPPTPQDEPTPKISEKDARSYWVVPYEWFSRSKLDPGCSGRGCEVGEVTYRPPFDDVLLLWVNEDELHGKPLHMLARILTHLLVQQCGMPVIVLGPTNSDTLLKMREEKKWKRGWEAYEPALDGATFYSPRATAPETFLSSLLHPHHDDAPPVPRRLREIGIGSDAFLDLSTVREPNDVTVHHGGPGEVGGAGWLCDPNADITFERTIASDEDTCERLVKELELRGSDPSDPNNHIILIMEWDTLYGRVLPRTFEAVVRRRLCARARGEPFADWPLCSFLRTMRVPESVKDRHGRNWAEIWQLGHIHSYTYLRGIDGRLPGDESPERGAGSDTSNGKPGGIPYQDVAPARDAAAEQPEGRAQLDYVRRMERWVKKLERECRAGGKRCRLKAIGVLGTDVYDKLLILRSLRPLFPRAIFFTVDLDANLLHPDEKEATRNLVIASPFGLQLDEGLQQSIPPFRDSYQTAAFCATLKALEHPAVYDQQVPRPRVYERGRSGAYDLSYFEDPRDALPLPSGDRGRSSGWNRFMCCVFVVSVLVLFLVLYGHRLQNWVRWEPGYKRWWIVAAITFLVMVDASGLIWREYFSEHGEPFVLFEGSVCYVFVVSALVALLVLFSNRLQNWLRRVLRYKHWRVKAAMMLLVMVGVGWYIGFQHFSEDGEPFELFEGISIWPTQLLQLFSVVLSVCFLHHMWQRLRENRRDIEKELFRIPDAQGASNSSEEEAQGSPRTCKQRLADWKTRCRKEFPSPLRVLLPGGEIRRYAREDNGPHEEEKPDVGSLWDVYNQCRRTPSRLVRTGAGLVVFHLLWCSLSTLRIEEPAYALSLGRGEWSHAGAWLIGLLSYSVLIVLLLLVLDATILCDSVIQRLFDPKSKLDWPKPARKFHADLHGLLAEDVDEWLGIRLISEHTKCVGRTIYFPFIILFILLAARDPTFDGWSWPVSSVIVLALILLAPMYAAVILRVSARRARETALARLSQKLTEARKDDEEGSRTVKLARLRQEIRDERSGAFCPITENPIIHAGGLGTVAVLNQVLVALG